MSEKLKPCPFCGAVATSEVRVTQMGGDTDNIDFRIMCSSCGICKTIRLKIVNTCVFLDVEKAMIRAVEAWNERVDPWKGEENGRSDQP